MQSYELKERQQCAIRYPELQALLDGNCEPIEFDGEDEDEPQAERQVNDQDPITDQSTEISEKGQKQTPESEAKREAAPVQRLNPYL